MRHLHPELFSGFTFQKAGEQYQQQKFSHGLCGFEFTQGGFVGEVFDVQEAISHLIIIFCYLLSGGFFVATPPLTIIFCYLLWGSGMLNMFYLF